ncbi:MAG: glucuronate isomerase, partial [Oscillospiraceae bacterium]|nr:glucuronate isomerase [Oscillospiraceae bacterium]
MEQLGNRNSQRNLHRCNGKEALTRRIDFFASMGCRTSDHALDGFDLFVKPEESAVNEALAAA